MTENRSVFLSAAMTPSDSKPPASEYRMPKTPENRNPDMKILIRFIESADFASIRYSAMTMTMFAMPSLTPGMPMLNGRIASTYEKIRARLVRRAIFAMRRLRVMARILGRKVFRRARAKGFSARGVTLKLKYADFRSVSRTAAVPGGVQSGEDVGDLAVGLLTKTEAGTAPDR